MHQVCIENSPEKSPDYIHAENSSTGCTSITVVFFILFYFQSVRSIVNQEKIEYFTVLNVFFKSFKFCFWHISQSFDYKKVKNKDYKENSGTVNMHQEIALCAIYIEKR